MTFSRIPGGIGNDFRVHGTCSCTGIFTVTLVQPIFSLLTTRTCSSTILTHPFSLLSDELLGSSGNFRIILTSLGIVPGTGRILSETLL